MNSSAWLQVGLVIGIIGALALGLINNARLERRVYWSTWLLSPGVMTLGAAHRGWRTALVIYGV
ncbi:MAG: hypothetical protein K0R01_505, partial [Mycobacterium sp.]|nr:hypothetical protein [Mycobacterium sp.]